MEILNKLSIKIPSDPFLPHENPVSSQFGQNVGLCLVNILVMAAKSGSKLPHVKSVEQEQKYIITLLRGWILDTIRHPFTTEPRHVSLFFKCFEAGEEAHC